MGGALAGDGNLTTRAEASVRIHGEFRGTAPRGRGHLRVRPVNRRGTPSQLHADGRQLRAISESKPVPNRTSTDAGGRTATPCDDVASALDEEQKRRP